MHYIILSTKTAFKHGTAAGLHGHFGLMQSSDRVHGLFGKVLGSYASELARTAADKTLAVVD
jgi:hypothetical protein